MKLTDLIPLEKWGELEKDVYERSGLEANVFNVDGYRITSNKIWVNKLCPEIKATDRGQAFICAVAHMNLAAQAKNAGQPVIEECDAGLVKIVVPISVEGEFIGAFGACGLLLDDAEVDDFMISKTTGISEATIRDCSVTLKHITTSEARQVADYIQDRIAAIVQAYGKMANN